MYILGIVCKFDSKGEKGEEGRGLPGCAAVTIKILYALISLNSP